MAMASSNFFTSIELRHDLQFSSKAKCISALWCWIHRATEVIYRVGTSPTGNLAANFASRDV
jgi:hypothetical protein